jgi:hypothetical protein
MLPDFKINPALDDLGKRHLEWYREELRPYYFGCRLRILIVADSFIYFNDADFGLSEVVATLRGMSTFAYPVTVDLAHRGNPGAARLAGGTSGFTFSDASLANYHQVWIFAAEYPSRDGPRPPISQDEQRAIRKFMDNGGGVFATGDHEDLGVTVGGYIPRVRSMRRWFFPGTGPDGEPVAPHGRNATRHDTNRKGHNASWSFDDQSDDVPQEIIPHYFGSSALISSVHPVLCTKDGPIRVLPDHAHEGRCEVPGNLGRNFTIGGDVFREYPDGPDGQPLAPRVIATATMIAGAAAPEFDKPPVPGGSFGVIAAWDGHRAGNFGRVVVDATWHHFININLIGDRSLGAPDPAIPKTMGFLHTPAGVAHYEKIKAYFRNIADWLTPRSRRSCLIKRHIWAATQTGWFLENYRRDDLVYTGNLVFGRAWPLRPCDRLNLIVEVPELQRWPWLDLFDPQVRFPEIEKLRDTGRFKVIEPLLKAVPAAMLGAVAVEMAQLDLPVEKLERELGDDESRIPELDEATKRGAERGAKFVEKMLGEFGDAAKVLDEFGRR